MSAKTGNPFINRELSWLEFNARVLEEARDPQAPLLERLKFLAISGSNLDEFFMIRVGGLQTLARQGVTKPDPSGSSPAQQLEAICQRTHLMVDAQYACFTGEMEPALSAAGIRRIKPGEISERQSRILVDIFESEVFSVLSPTLVHAPSDLPLLGNRILHLCVRLRGDAEGAGRPKFALIPLGQNTRRFVTLPSDTGYEYMLLEDVVALFADLFFPGQKVMECVPFRITRNADVGVREDMAADLLEEMEELLSERKRSDCVRLEVADSATQGLLSFLQRALLVEDEDIYAVDGPLDVSAFMQLAALPGFESFKYEPWPPQAAPEAPPGMSLFKVLARQDLLLAHPYDSFEPVARFLDEAADDPDVLAIKQTLYRTSHDSPIVAALLRAATRGKYVTAIVELKARFDEARNIEWAKTLEEAGVQVIYGIKGLKTHAKICIVVRREPDGIRRYIHFGTGNYNELTARLYSDISYMTANPELGADATAFFNAVTGYSEPQSLRRLAMAPLTLRERLLELIASETERKRQGQKARIVAKLNSLVDPKLIQALYEASGVGVKIRLNVRGICCLRPGVAGLSENIRVVSIVDRFLEHSRIFAFHHGGDELVYISSADWMPRNLDRRIELLVPVDDPESKRRLLETLDTYFLDNVKARELQGDGSYVPVEASAKRGRVRSQEALYEQARERVRQTEDARRVTFELHRPPGAPA